MKRILVTLAGLAMVAGAARAADLNVYFSAAGIPSVSGVPITLPNVPPADPNANAPQFGRNLDNNAPVVNPSVTGGRLFIWATGTAGNPDPNTWNGLSVNVVITGPATITGGGEFNVRRTAAPMYRRWETGSDFTQPTFNLIAVQGAGISFPTASDGFDDGTDMVLLGYLDFANGGGTSTVRFQVGNGGITRVNGNVVTDGIIFGQDTQILRGNQFGMTSTLADATITPEPASLLLLALAGLALRRR